jgi:hypothetical protein
MAGRGVKLFVSGEVARAVEVNEYLMDQVISRFPTVAARDTAFGNGQPVTVEISPGVFGDGKPSLTEGRFCYIDDLNEVQYYDGDAWQAASQFSIGDGAITEIKLAPSAVTETKIANGAVTSAKILNGTIVDADINSSANISLTKLANGALPSGITISSSNIPDITIETSDIQNGAVTTDKLDGTSNSEAVTTAKIRNGAVTSPKLGNSLTLAGTTTFGQIVETAATNTTTVLSPTVTHVDVLSGAVYRYINAGHSNGFKLNLRGNNLTTLSSLMTTNTQAITVVVSVLSGNPAVSFAGTSDYLTIDTNATVNIKWFGGTKPSGNINSEDFYTFTIFKTGATAFTVFASQSKFA